MMDDIYVFIDELYEAADYSIPVRAMQKLLARGVDAIDPLIEVLRDEDADNAATWAAVVLGVLRAARAAPEVADAVRRSPPNARWLHVPFAEALASIGSAAIPAIKQLAVSDRMSDRIWAYYAAGLVRAPEVYDFLIASLESDAGMMDVVGNALADFGDRAAIEPLYDALRRAAVWQRPDIEDAIRSLHHERWRSSDWPNRDWRTRYRLNDFLSGHYPTSWAVIAAIVREEGMLEDRAELPLRPLEEILADPDDWPVDRCECCQLPTWRTTGVPVCAQTAAAVPAMQAGLLGKRRDASGINDIFDMLDDIEDEMRDLAESQRPSRGRARERWEDRMLELRSMQHGLMWAVEQDADTVGAVRAMLLAEAGRAAEEHGDPMGVLRPVAGVRAPAAGRNELCPCGSGRKYKKCCGNVQRRTTED